MAKIELLCPYCGAAAVIADACATWNAETGAWELCSTYDDKSCNACEREFDTALEIDLDKLGVEGSEAWIALAKAALARPSDERTLTDKYLLWTAQEQGYDLEKTDA